MRLALVEFVVQIPDDGDIVDAICQAELYLCTGERHVDFNVKLLLPQSLPIPAKHLPKEGG